MHSYIKYFTLPIIAITVLVWIGWIFDIVILKSIIPGFISMNPMTAICFMMQAVGLFYLGKHALSHLVLKIIGGFTMVVTLLILSDKFLFTEFGLDKILFAEDLNGNQMAVATTLNFILMSISLFLSGKNRTQGLISQLLALCCLALSLIYLCAYVFLLNSIIGLSAVTPMALHTSICFILLSIACLYISPKTGFLEAFTSEAMGGIMTRKVLPLILIIPFLIGYLRLLGERNNLYSTEFGIAIMAVSIALCTGIIMWNYANILNSIHEKWMESEGKLETKNLILTTTTADLESKMKQLEDFNHIVAHNLRGPSGSILMMIGMVAEAETDQDRAEMLGMLKKSSQNLNDTLNDLMAVLEVRLNKNITFDTCNLEQLTQQVSTMLKGEIITKKALIITSFEMEQMQYPRVYLESIFYNMISNALKYSDKTRLLEIHITSKLVNNRIRLSFKDNGLGIDLKKHRDNLFKLNKVFHAGFDSKGVGLFMTKNHIETFGGSIEVKSEPQKGSEFIVFL